MIYRSTILAFFLSCVLSFYAIAQTEKTRYGNGLDKKDADDQISLLFESVKNAQNQVQIPKSEQLIDLKNADFLVLPGDTFMIESIRSESFYYNKEGSIIAVFDSLHLRESISNLLLQRVDMSDLQVDVLHRKYGLYLPDYKLRWADLLSVIMDKGNNGYAAVQIDSPNRQATGILLVDHPSHGYIHLLMLSIPCSALFTNTDRRGKGTTISGLLYTNIPYSNVFDLFEERKNNFLQ